MSNPDRSVPCSLQSCPQGCTIITLGETVVHLAPADFLKVVKLMLHHAWTQGLEVPTDATSRPLPVYH